MKYLGVNMPKDLLDLFDRNCHSLTQNINSDLNRWNRMPIVSFGSRIESVRMNILPRLRFLFQKTLTLKTWEVLHFLV